MLRAKWAPAAGFGRRRRLRFLAQRLMQHNPMAQWTMALLSQRAIERMGVDVPADLLAMECSDILRATKSRVLAEVRDRIIREGGKPAFDRRPMFGFPAMPTSSRLRSTTSHQSFHLAINKRLARSAAGFDRYATAPEKATTQPGTVQEQTGGKVAANHDRYAVGHGGVGEASPDMTTNLSPDGDRRREQWDAIEDHERRHGLVTATERSKGADRINLRVDHAPQFAELVAAQPDCPAELRALIQQEAERIADGVVYDGRKAAGAPWVTGDAEAVHRWIRSLPEWKSLDAAAQRAFKFSGGRSVQTHIAFELEMPAEFDARAYGNVRQGLHDHLRGLPGAEPDTTNAMQLPVMITTHQPDSLNDRRNGHIHGLIGTRRCALDAEGEFILGKGDVPVFDARKVPAITAIVFPKQLRSHCADLINVELDRLGADYRLSPETYAKLGIHAASQRKLHGGQTVLSRAGVVTEDEQYNVTEAWRRKFADVRSAHDRELAGTQVEAVRLSKRIDQQGLAAVDWDLLQNWSELSRQKRKDALRLRREAAEIDLLMEMAKSRPALVAQFAPGYAAKFAKARSRYDRDGWLKRLTDAEVYDATLAVELATERTARAERLAEADRLEREATALLEQTEAGLVAAKEGKLAPPVVVAEPERLSSAEVNAMIDEIMRTPLRLVRAEQLYAVDRRDDPEGRFALALFESVSIQRRLARIAANRETQPGPLAAWLAKHPGEDPANAPAHIAEQARVWAATRPNPVTGEPTAETDAVPATPSAAPAAGTPREDLPAKLVGVPATALPSASPSEPRRIAMSEIMALARVERQAAEQRTAAVLKAQLRQLVAPRGSIGPVAQAFLRDLHDHPEYYARGARGALVCKSVGGNRQIGFDLMMRDDEVGRLADAVFSHATGQPTSSFPSWLLSGGREGQVSPQSWMNETARAAERLSERLPEILEARPLLTRGHDYIGIADEHMVAAAGADALGLYSPQAQQRLEAAYRIQEAEREHCLALVASGGIAIRTRVQREPRVATRVEAAGDQSLPESFARFVHDPWFLEQCHKARRDPKPRPKLLHPAIAAWQKSQDDNASSEVLEDIARAVFKLPDHQALLVAAGKNLAWEIARSADKQHAMGWMFPPRRGRGSGRPSHSRPPDTPGSTLNRGR